MHLRGRRRAATHLAAVATVVLALACGSKPEDGDRPDSAAQSRADSASASLPALSWRLESPKSWDARVRVVDDPEGEARLAAQGIHAATRFEYLPRDTSVVPQTLLGVYVYDSTAWAKLQAEDGPPQGEVVERGPGVVYVVGLPQSNPFGWGSADSVEFEKRTVTLEFVKRAFRVVR